MSFALYILGFLILIGGVAWALLTAGVSTLYVMIACVILLGIGILSAVTHTRSKDRPKDPSA
jgi:amino acid transporter